MKKKLISVVCLLILAVTVVLSQTDSLQTLINTLLNPPKTGGTATEIFGQWSTYLTAVVAFITIYLSKWLPFLGPVFNFMKPYWRYVIIGVIIVIAAIKLNIFSTGAGGWVLFLSSLFYEILKFMGLGKIDDTTTSLVIEDKK